MNGLDVQILLVDDEAELLEVLKEYLEYYGFTDVRAAGSGAEAINLYSERKAEIVFCDLKMPRMNGLDVYTELKKRSEDVNFVLLTGSDLNDINHPNVEALGSIEIIKKPFQFETIISRILKVRGFTASETA